MPNKGCLGKRMIKATKFIPALLAIAACAAMIACTHSGQPSNTHSPLTPTERYKPLYPEKAQSAGVSACMTFTFTVTAEGKVANMHLARAYPGFKSVVRLGLLRSGRNTLSKWQFNPRLENGRPVATQGVFQSLLYYLSGNPQGQLFYDSLDWFCSGDLFTATDIKLATPSTHETPAAATSGWSTPQASVGPAQYTIMLDMAQTQAMANIQKTAVSASYCIDPHGRMANVILKGASSGSETRRMALLALNKISVVARSSGNAPVWTCGLHTTIRFHDRTQDGYVGTIERSRFHELTAHSTAPRFISATPPELPVSIPNDADLPPKASIEMKFCIAPDGEPYNIQVSHANPPKIFNRAAVKTVAGWHFARGYHAMCDVYQTVSFTIPHAGD